MLTEEIYKDIYRIGVTLPGSPLKELNSYFIRGTDDDHDILIDTGFRRPACEEALSAGLLELKSDPARRRVLLTHMHADHSGMADIFVGPGQPIYMTGTDYDYMLRFRSGRLDGPRQDKFIREGFPPELMEEMYRKNPAMNEQIKKAEGQFVLLKDQDELHVGRYCLRTLMVPGHTPGNAMFYIEDEAVMFTGDHVLFDISPNITWWPDREDSLSDYLESLQKYMELPVAHAFPGHRHSGDYKSRITTLIAHHGRRLEEAMGLIEAHPGINAYDLTGLMRWKIHARNWEEFPVVQKWFAVGECLAHLDYLRLRGQIRRQMEDNGMYGYYIVHY